MDSRCELSIFNSTQSVKTINKEHNTCHYPVYDRILLVMSEFQKLTSNIQILIKVYNIYCLLTLELDEIIALHLLQNFCRIFHSSNSTHKEVWETSSKHI